jgi:hypothetical protein
VYDAAVAKKPKRARTERREQERGLRKEVRAVERLASQAPGGAPDRPLVVTSAAVIEVQARSTPCPQCGGTLDLRRHDAVVEAGQSLRVVELLCRLCHAPRRLYFRVDAPLAN